MISCRSKINRLTNNERYLSLNNCLTQVFFGYKTNVPLESEEARNANQPDFKAQILEV